MNTALIDDWTSTSHPFFDAEQRDRLAVLLDARRYGGDAYRKALRLVACGRDDADYAEATGAFVLAVGLVLDSERDAVIRALDAAIAKAEPLALTAIMAGMDCAWTRLQRARTVVRHATSTSSVDALDENSDYFVAGKLDSFVKRYGIGTLFAEDLVSNGIFRAWYDFEAEAELSKLPARVISTPFPDITDV